MNITLFGRRLSNMALAITAICLAALGAMLAGELAGAAAGRTLAAAIGGITDRDGNGLDPADEGRLVRISGPLTTTAPLTDPETGFTLPAMVLRRDVEAWTVLPPTNAPDGTPRPRGLWLPLASGSTWPGDWPRGLHRAEFINPTTRIGAVPLTPSLAGATQLGEGRLVPDIAAPRLAARRPTRDGDWLLFAADPATRQPGDVRLAYRALARDGVFTAVGRQRDGRLDLAEPAGPWPLPNQHPVTSFLPRGMAEARGEAVFLGRIMGLLVLVVGFMTCALLRAEAGTDEAGRRQLRALGHAASMLEPLAWLVALPFALLAAPAALVLGLLAWWMAGGGLALAAGAGAVLAAMLLALAATADRTPPGT